MRIGIRPRLVALLVLVAVLPLGMALAAITIGGRRFRIQSLGQAIRAMAFAEANAVGVVVGKDVEKIHVGLQQSRMVVSLLAACTDKLPQAELDELDTRWPTMSPDDPAMASVLNHPIAERLRAFQKEDSRLAELLVTDCFGQLIAATGRTSDYYQADEAWWQGANHDGRGRLFVTPVDYDHSTGIWSLDLCIPIRSEGKVVGVVKTVLAVSRWVGSRSSTIGGVPVHLMLARDDGTIVYRHGLEPLSEVVKDWHGRIASGKGAGWRTTRDGQIQGFARVVLPEKIGPEPLVGPSWSLIYYASKADALGAVYRLSLIVLAIGLAIIGGIFLFGLFLAERGIVRRVRRLEHATRQVAGGDLTHRIESRPGGPGLLGRDEIDALSDDFNRMIGRVQDSHSELESANELKVNFIRVASHELRTPISYILATVKLLRDSTDPDRLLQAVQSMGAKAKRLDEIIQAMFKLMPDQQYSEHLNYGEVIISELLEEVYLDCFPFVQGRDQQFIIENGQDLGTIEADRAKLRDILENLVMNAIKFTPDKGVIKLRVAHELGGHVSFSIQDQGPGINEQDMPYIFEPFYGSKDVMKHSSGKVGFQKRGMGLGLAIVKHFTEMQGGTVRVDVTATGTTFTVTLPAGPTPDRPGEADRQH